MKPISWSLRSLTAVLLALFTALPLLTTEAAEEMTAAEKPDLAKAVKDAEGVKTAAELKGSQSKVLVEKLPTGAASAADAAAVAKFKDAVALLKANGQPTLHRELVELVYVAPAAEKDSKPAKADGRLVQVIKNLEAAIKVEEEKPKPPAEEEREEKKPEETPPAGTAPMPDAAPPASSAPACGTSPQAAASPAAPKAQDRAKKPTFEEALKKAKKAAKDLEKVLDGNAATVDKSGTLTEIRRIVKELTGETGTQLETLVKDAARQLKELAGPNAPEIESKVKALVERLQGKKPQEMTEPSQCAAPSLPEADQEADPAAESEQPPAETDATKNQTEEAAKDPQAEQLEKAKKLLTDCKAIKTDIDDLLKAEKGADDKLKADKLQTRLAEFFAYGESLAVKLKEALEKTELPTAVDVAKDGGKLRPIYVRELPNYVEIDRNIRAFRKAQGDLPKYDGDNVEALHEADRPKPEALRTKTDALGEANGKVIQSFAPGYDAVRVDSDKYVNDVSDLTAELRRLIRERAQGELDDADTDTLLVKTTPELRRTLLNILSDLSAMQERWQPVAAYLNETESNRSHVKTADGSLASLRAMREILAGASQLLEEALIGDVGAFVNEQVRLYYFTDVLRLMRALNPATDAFNPQDARFQSDAAKVRKELLEKEALLFQKQGEVETAKTDLIDARKELAGAAIALNRSKQSVLQAKSVKAGLEAKQTTATADYNAVKDSADVPQATKDLLKKAKDDADAAVAAQQTLVAAAETAETAAGKRHSDLTQRTDTAPTREEASVAEVKRLQTEIRDLRRDLVFMASEEAEAFGEARDRAVYYFAPATAASSDPARRVMMFAYEDSKTIFIRGLAADVEQAIDIIASFDRPAPQARITLWTIQMNGRGTGKLNQKLALVDAELRNLRANVTAVQEHLRNAVNKEVNRVGQTIEELTAGTHYESKERLARYFFYPLEVRQRLGSEVPLPQNWSYLERAANARYDLQEAVTLLRKAQDQVYALERGDLSKKQKENRRARLASLVFTLQNAVRDSFNELDAIEKQLAAEKGNSNGGGGNPSPCGAASAAPENRPASNVSGAEPGNAAQLLKPLKGSRAEKEAASKAIAGLEALATTEALRKNSLATAEKRAEAFGKLHEVFGQKPAGGTGTIQSTLQGLRNHKFFERDVRHEARESSVANLKDLLKDAKEVAEDKGLPTVGDLVTRFKNRINEDSVKSEVCTKIVSDSEYVTRWTLPDPAHSTTLGETFFVMSLARRSSRARIVRDFYSALAEWGVSAEKDGDSNEQSSKLASYITETLRALEQLLPAQNGSKAGPNGVVPTYPFMPRALFGATNDDRTRLNDTELTANQLEILLALQAKARENLAAEVKSLLRQIDRLSPSEKRNGGTGTAWQWRSQYLPFVGYLASSYNKSDSFRTLAPSSIDNSWTNRGLAHLSNGSTESFVRGNAASLLSLDRGAWAIAGLEGQRNQLARATPRVAAADEMIKRLMVIAENDLDHYFVSSALDKIRGEVHRDGVELGVLQRTSILATNRRVARVDPRANADVELATQDNLLQAAAQLGQLAEQAQPAPTTPAVKKSNADKKAGSNAILGGGLAKILGASQGGAWGIGGLLGILGGLDKDKEGEEPQGEVYSINSGDLFKVTPIFDPSGQALRFKFDYAATVRIQEPDGTTNRQIPRVERHTVNTEVQVSNFELREVSRFEANSKLGVPPRRYGGLPFIRNLPILKDIPVLGYFSRQKGQDGKRQESVILAQSVVYPSVGEIVDLLVDVPPSSSLDRSKPRYLREADEKEQLRDAEAEERATRRRASSEKRTEGSPSAAPTTLPMPATSGEAQGAALLSITAASKAMQAALVSMSAAPAAAGGEPEAIAPDQAFKEATDAVAAAGSAETRAVKHEAVSKETGKRINDGLAADKKQLEEARAALARLEPELAAAKKAVEEAEAKHHEWKCRNETAVRQLASARATLKGLQSKGGGAAKAIADQQRAVNKAAADEKSSRAVTDAWKKEVADRRLVLKSVQDAQERWNSAVTGWHDCGVAAARATHTSDLWAKAVADAVGKVGVWFKNAQHEAREAEHWKNAVEAEAKAKRAETTAQALLRDVQKLTKQGRFRLADAGSAERTATAQYEQAVNDREEAARKTGAAKQSLDHACRKTREAAEAARAAIGAAELLHGHVGVAEADLIKARKAAAKATTEAQLPADPQPKTGQPGSSPAAKSAH